ncbi:MAG: enoyl-CoA hydratase-related protein [Sphingomonadaceae bacterium]
MLSFPSSVIRMRMASEHVALVTIDREECRNAVDADVALGLEDAVRAAEQDKTIRLAILTGAGQRCFCSGADLKTVAEGRVDSLFTTDGGFAGFTKAARTKPWIAAVNGYALAGGFEIALACDLIVSADTASFGLPEVKCGLVAGGGGAFRLSQKLPANIACEFLLTGEPMPAARALELGLVNRVVALNELIDEAIQLGQSIATNSPSSIRQTLQILRKVRQHLDAKGWTESEAAMAVAVLNSDFVEGPAAFIERRPPQWRDEQS